MLTDDSYAASPASAHAWQPQPRTRGHLKARVRAGQGHGARAGNSGLLVRLSPHGTSLPHSLSFKRWLERTFFRERGREKNPNVNFRPCVSENWILFPKVCQFSLFIMFFVRVYESIYFSYASFQKPTFFMLESRTPTRPGDHCSQTSIKFPLRDS